MGEKHVSLPKLEPIEANELEDDPDLWMRDEVAVGSAYPSSSQRWEAFYDPSFVEPSAYLSELGPAAFDAALVQSDNRSEKSQTVSHTFRQPPVLRSLRLVGLGFSSWLFEHDLTSNKFRSKFPQKTISGLSQSTTESLIQGFADCGARFRRLGHFTEKYLVSKTSSSSAVAMARLISNAVDALSFIILEDTAGTHSFLQLQDKFEKPSNLLILLCDLADLVEAARNDIALLSSLFQFACLNESRSPGARSLMVLTLKHVSEPWLYSMSCCLGMRGEAGCDKTLISRIKEEARDHVKRTDATMRDSAIPTFISRQDKTAMLETCNEFVLLQQYLNDDTKATTNVYESQPDELSLMWHFEGSALQDDFARIQKREATLASVLTSPNDSHFSHTPSKALPGATEELSFLDPYGDSGHSISDQSDIAAMRMESDVFATRDLTPESDVAQAVRICLTTASHSHILQSTYPLSLAPHLSFAPLVESQHRVLGRACLGMLFRRHGLREHLLLQYRFHLFGDGGFAARLSQALFSEGLSPVGARRDFSQPSNYSLSLKNRKTWPPGGSELRLALMDILSVTYFDSHTLQSSSTGQLPGGLSFGIRNLSEAEIAQVMDPNGLAALDFLRLQYTAPSPLDLILSEEIMDKYDTIFKLLLRVSRVSSANLHISSLRNSDQSETKAGMRFRIAASRFTEALSSYFSQTAIVEPWHYFLARLTELEKSLDTPLEHISGSISSIRELRAAHESMLDNILAGLMLRQRQVPIMNLLEEIFGIILRFSEARNQTGRSSPKDEDIEKLYDAFTSKVGTFLSVCRGLSGKQSYMASSGATSGVTISDKIDDLILRLDMNGWWSAHA